MRIDPMDEWCSNCGRTGHSDPRCPYVECHECDGSGETGPFDALVQCTECNGRGYYRK